MDEFAQTGAQQDDLFDDIQYAPGGEESMQTRAPDDLFGEDFTPIAEPVVVEEPVPTSEASVPQVTKRGGRGGGNGRGGRGEARGRGEGRGRGERRGGRGGRVAREQQQQLQRPKETEFASTSTPAATETSASQSTEQPTTEPAETTPATETPSSTAPTPSGPGPLADSRYATTTATTEPNKPTTTEPTKPPTTSNAARGDRRATGGLQKPKLTPAELEAKMQRMSLRSAELTERHQRAEADRQSFDKREEVAKEVAKQRSKEERRDRQQMMGEREKNRQRKLKAMEGREWDMQKQEADYDPRAAAAAQRGGFGRGANGGVVGARDAGGASASGFGRDQEDYTDGREYLYRENNRGRGGRGGRGGAGRGGSEQQRAPKHTDFPELPAATKEKAGQEEAKQASSGATPAPAALAELPKPDDSVAAGGKSWADMIEG